MACQYGNAKRSDRSSAHAWISELLTTAPEASSLTHSVAAAAFLCYSVKVKSVTIRVWLSICFTELWRCIKF